MKQPVGLRFSQFGARVGERRRAWTSRLQSSTYVRARTRGREDLPAVTPLSNAAETRRREIAGHHRPIACYLAFWSLLVRGPIGALIVAVLAGQSVAIALAVCVGSVVAALLARAVGRGILRGHRAAYGVVCLLMLGATAFYVWRALMNTSSTAVFAASRAAVFFCLALFVAGLTVRKGAANA